MSSWVYLISKFTPEMLFLEAIAIFTLLGSYSVFWVLRKRRLGAVKDAVPAGVVKEYLNELIQDAVHLRTMMFGLISSAGLQIPTDATGALAGGLTAVDPSILKKVGELEGKMTEQARAMEAVVQEKTRIEKELNAAKAAGTTAGQASPKNDGLIDELKRKIALLEGKLAEYSVIEDDLANLKKLQQENASLRASLGDTKPAAPAPAKAEKPAQEKPAAVAAPAPAAAAPVVTAEAAGPAIPTLEPKLEVVFDTPAEPAAAFEGLVDQVEKSLQPEAPAAPAVAAAPAPELHAEVTPSVETAAPAQMAAAGDADADLVAEFEKMLNS